MDQPAEANGTPNLTRPAKATYSVKEIKYMLKIGNNAAYNLVNSGLFKSTRINGKIFVFKKDFDRWLDGENKKAGGYSSV